MMLRRRNVLQASVLAPLAVTDRWGSAEVQTRTVIRAVPEGDLKVLDPIWTTAYITRNHGYKVWDTLFALDEQNRPQPQMVDTYSVSDDQLIYTFRLRANLLWHDGAPVRATDCVASIRRWGARDAMGRALLAETMDLAAIDDNSFRVVFRQRLGFVLDALAKIDSPVPFMMPERLAKTDPFKQITESIGSGPFRFVAAEWVPGVKAVYERFSGYVPRPEPASQAAGGKIAKVDRIELVYLPDASLAADALIKGEIDILESPAPDLLGLLRRSTNVKVEAINPLGSGLFMVINHRQPPFDRKEARQALLWALDQSDFMNATVGDRNPWRECLAMYGCGTSNESQQGTEPMAAHDPAKARTLLTASGYDNRPIVVLDPADSAVLHAAALMTAELLRRIGAKVDVQVMDWSTLVQRRTSINPPAEGGWNLFVTGATISSISNPLTNNFARNCEERSITGACEPRIVELTRAWSHETIASQRRQIIDSLQRLLIEDVTYVPLGQFQGVIAHRTSLSGLINAPALFYWNIAQA